MQACSHVRCSTHQMYNPPLGSFVTPMVYVILPMTLTIRLVPHLNFDFASKEILWKIQLFWLSSVRMEPFWFFLPICSCSLSLFPCPIPHSLKHLLSCKLCVVYYCTIYHFFHKHVFTHSFAYKHISNRLVVSESAQVPIRPYNSSQVMSLDSL